MDSIPQDLTVLKRQALQKLCKKMGLKANGKNVQMIAALEKLREERATIETEIKEGEEEAGASETPMLVDEALPTPEKATPTKEPSPDAWVTPPTSLSPKKNRGSKPTSPDTTGDLVSPPSHSPSPSSAARRRGRKRKRRDTYSISPNNSLLSCLHSSSNKHPRLDIEEHVTSTGLVNSSMSVKEEELPSSSPPFSPPATPERQQGSASKRHRNATYTITSTTPETESAGINEDGDVPSTKRRRRSTYEILPENSSLLSNNNSVVGIGCGDSDGIMGMEMGASLDPKSVKSESSSDDVMKEELLNLLQQRVEERKADPNYKPAFAESTTVSRIPVKSATTKKFDRVHEKHFNRMQSIASSYEAKLANSCKKSATTQRKRSLTSKSKERGARKVNENVHLPSPKQQNNKTTTTARPSVGKGWLSQTSAFRPNGKASSFNYCTEKKAVKTGPTKPANDTDVKISTAKTPLKTFVFSADNSHPHSIKKLASTKRTFDLQASLKKPKPSYKVYSGKVPRMN